MIVTIDTEKALSANDIKILKVILEVHMDNTDSLLDLENAGRFLKGLSDVSRKVLLEVAKSNGEIRYGDIVNNIGLDDRTFSRAIAGITRRSQSRFSRDLLHYDVESEVIVDGEVTEYGVYKCSQITSKELRKYFDL